MLAALTLCLGLQSGVASAAPDAGARALHVFVEDEAGTLLVDGWSVQLGRLSGSTVRWLETARVDPTSGIAEFEVSDEPIHYVQARHEKGELGRHELVALAPRTHGAGVAVHRLVFDRPRPERTLYVDVSDPFGIVLSAIRTIVAIDRNGRELTLVPDPGNPGRHVARDVAPGGYRIELRDPRYLPVLIERHTPGLVAAVQPVGSAALVVTFVDAVDGHALTPEDLTVMTGVQSRSDGSVTSLVGFPTNTPSAPRNGEARLDGLVAGTSTTLHATFPRHFAASVDVADIAPGETRRVTQRVERARSMTGTIVDPTGAPVSGVTVTTADGQGDGPRSLGPGNTFIVSGRISVGPSAGGAGVTTSAAIGNLRKTLMGLSRTTVATATSDDAGRFELHGLGNGPTQLEAHFTPWHREALTLPALTESTSTDRASRIDGGGAVAAADEAPPILLRAAGACSADLLFVIPQGTTLAHYDASLQLGSAPWLHGVDKVAPLVDDQQMMKLRGLTGAPCRLDVRLREGAVWPPVARDTVPSSLTFEFVPRADAPTRVRVHLGPLVGDQ